MENPMRQGDDKPEIGVVRQKPPGRAAFYAAQKTFRHDGYQSAPLPDGLEQVEDAQDIGFFSRKPVFIQAIVLVVSRVFGKGNVRQANRILFMDGMRQGVGNKLNAAMVAPMKDSVHLRYADSVRGCILTNKQVFSVWVTSVPDMVEGFQ
jgi:hypothetical protein